MDESKHLSDFCTGNYLSKSDAEVFSSIKDEYNRQRDNIELIASENYVSTAVLEAAGSMLTNKYAEGYPGRRYYGGCEYVDDVERIAIKRAKEIFKCDHVNVQAHAGSQANMAAYFALIEPGARVMAMDLKHGGHLTHGSKVNFSGRMYEIIPYGVRPEDCRIDYDALAKTARETKPALIVGGATAYPRIIDFVKFKEIADEVGARLMIDTAHIAGLIAGGVHPSPVPYADVVTGTTHKTLRGPRGGFILSTEEYQKAVDRQIFPGIQGGPLMHIIAAKAVAFGEVLRPEFKTYTAQVVKNCKILADELMANGFKLVSGGTDNHLILLDLSEIHVTGKKAEEALGVAGITVNKNSIPFDPEKPTITSGVRIGTAALTTRGMREDEMRAVGSLIWKVIHNIDDEGALKKVRTETLELARTFPIFAW
ncbi:MAG: serine hydroxymethyltransferase [Candidatus Latescibacteria bacterium]|nr:serine hydroxymethyltransferase [Candidatus Latescibacterota bacterium]